MVFEYSIKTAITGLTTHKSRSALTVLGIVIGVASIMLVMSLGQSAQSLILSEVNGLGADTIAVLPGKVPTGPSSAASLLGDSLKDKDVTALENKTNVPHAKTVMPVVISGANAVHGNQVYQSGIFGGGTLMAQVFDLTPEAGTFFTDDDVLSKAAVAVIGNKVKTQLFGTDDAIGQKIRVNNTTLKIIGVLPEKGQSSFISFDDAILMPYTTAQEYILGIKYFSRIIVEADSQKNLESTAEDVKITIRNSHNITDPSQDDFSVETPADIANTLATVTNALTAFLAAVAAISLVVGGIGIMNIMLVSVTERTREIGLRKALGATNEDILIQFLLEAVILTATGGAIGIFLGSSLSYIIAIILHSVLGLNWQFIFPWLAAVLGILVASVTGLVFGIYPARQASRKSPMEALRYE